MNSKQLLILCLITVIVLVVVIVIYTSNKQGEFQETSPDKVYQDYDSIVYPYKTNEERVSRIKENCNKLKRGMTTKEVVELLGKPDKISPIYDTVKRGNVVGKSYSYLLSQDKKYGSINEMNRKAVVIHFNLEGKLILAYSQQFPLFKDIEKESQQQEKD